GARVWLAPDQGWPSGPRLDSPDCPHPQRADLRRIERAPIPASKTASEETGIPDLCEVLPGIGPHIPHPDACGIPASPPGSPLWKTTLASGEIKAAPRVDNEVARWCCPHQRSTGRAVRRSARGSWTCHSLSQQSLRLIGSGVVIR